MVTGRNSVGVMVSGLLMVLVALSGCQATTGKTAGQTISDASISSAVQTKLTSDHLSNFTRIDVDTERGVVNLSGVVETEEQRARAERLAHHVTGVVKVINSLQIQNHPPMNRPSSPPASDERRSERKVGQDPKEMTLQMQGVHLVQGKVVRVEGTTYFVQGQDGKEVSFQADPTTMKSEKIKTGDQIEAKVDENNHALSMLPAP